MIRQSLLSALIIFYCLFHGIEATSSQALSIPPSEFWDGNDGRWSSFQIQVGTPGQTVRLLPSTSASAGTDIWVVIPEGCKPPVVSHDLPDCAGKRGYLFNPDTSTTYSTQRLLDAGNGTIFSFNTVEEGLLGLQGYAYYGFDTISLGIPGSGLPSLQNQVIAAYAIDTFWVGSLGLSPLPTNFTNFNNPQPSVVGTLREQNLIPSSSWAYTAGAYYKDPPVFGSLTLGGFDASRFTANAVSFSFGADISRDLLVSIQSITTNILGASPLLASSIDIFIDSLVTEIWLPISVCEAFEQQFQLVWNSTSQRYLVDERTHEALIASNPSFNFTIAQSGTTGTKHETVDVVLPYSAFDMNLTAPVVNETSRYFPLKRAKHETQYTLGRVFLQEAYVIADYEQRNFSVSQALFPPTSVSQRIIAIEAPEQNEPSGNKAAHQGEGTNAAKESKSDTLSPGAIAGTVIGCVVGLALILAIILISCRRRRRRTVRKKDLSEKPDVEPDHAIHHPTIPEIDEQDTAVREMDETNALKPELPEDSRHELSPEARAAELAGEKVSVAELES